MYSRLPIILAGLVVVCSALGLPRPVQSTRAKNTAGVEIRQIDLDGLKKLLHRDPKDKRPLLINFWATWCDPCREEFPDLVKVDSDYRSKGLNFVAISLDDVHAPDDAMLGQVGDGFKVAMSSLDSGRFSVASGCVGICQGSLDASVKYSKERIQFGRPIASFQLVQEMLTDIALHTDAARMLVWRSAFLKDNGRPNTTETSMAKLFATEAAVHCANQAIQVHGGSGYVDDYPVERYLRDVRVTTLYEGTSQIQKLIIGRALTGINALVPS